MFSLFKDIHSDSIKKIESLIKDTDSYKYFAKDKSKLLVEYKEFEVTIVACAIYYLSIRQSRNNRDIGEAIKKIYFRRTNQFLRNQILTGELSWDLLSMGPSSRDETMIILTVFGKYNKYVTDIDSALKDGVPYWIEEFENSDDGISGVKHYYSFMQNVLTSEIKDESNQKYIDTKEVWELDEFEFKRFNSFLDSLKLISSAF